MGGSWFLTTSEWLVVGAEGGILQVEYHLVLSCPFGVVFLGLTEGFRAVPSAQYRVVLCIWLAVG